MCPDCAGSSFFWRARGVLVCHSCRQEQSPTRGTLLGETNIAPTDWLTLAWELSVRPGGVSTTHVARLLGLSFDLTWRLVHKLRRAMRAADVPALPLRGPVEVDEVFLGGSRPGSPVRGAYSKQKLLVLAERAPRRGKLFMRHIPSASARVLVPAVSAVVEPGATVLTDGWSGYNGLSAAGYRHQVFSVRGLDVPAHMAGHVGWRRQPVPARLVPSRVLLRYNDATSSTARARSTSSLWRRSGSRTGPARASRAGAERQNERRGPHRRVCSPQVAARTATVKPTKGHEQGAEHHVLVLPLAVNARERSIIEKRVRATMKLANAVLGDLLGRVQAMKRDPDYRAALVLPPGRKRNREFKRLRERHRIPAGKADAVLVAMEHWRSSSAKPRLEWPADATGYPQGWMTEVIAGRVAVALGPQVWTGVREWMLGRRGKPRFKSTRRLDRAVWNSDNKSGLTFDPETGMAQWNHPSGGASHPQTLRLRPKLKPSQQQWLKRLADRKVVSVGVKLDGPFVLLLLRVEGAPYRDPAYLDLVGNSAERVVGIDPAPTHPAISAPDETLTLDLISCDELVTARERAEWVAGQQRKQDASDRAMNPDAFHSDGTPVRGKKRRHSKTWQRRRARINRVQRQARMERKRTTTQLVREVTTRGADVVIERNSVKSWQAGGLKLGARVALTRPGQFRAALEREAGLLVQYGVPASYRELPTRQFPLTQQCLCGERTLRALSERVVTCPACGLGPLDRDQFSALKARLVGETGVATLDGGVLNIEDFRAQAITHCAATKPVADVAAGEDGDRTRDARGVSCQSEPSGSTSAGQPAQLAQAVSDLAAHQGGRAHRRVSDKRGNTRTHTEPATRAGRARTPREATRHGQPTSGTTPRWDSP